jgi:AraC-like DNA-binding protein
MKGRATWLEVVSDNRELLEGLAETGFNLRHVDYLDAVKEYAERVDRGEKREYLVATIAGRLGVSPRTFRRIIGEYLASARRGKNGQRG